MRNFRSALDEKLTVSRSNNFGVENYDEYRFGKWADRQKKTSIRKIDSLKGAIKKTLKKILYPARKENGKKHDFLVKHAEGFQKLWENVDEEGKELIVSLIAFRRLGYEKVKLPRNNSNYWSAINRAKLLKNPTDTYDPHFQQVILEKFDLLPIGHDVKLYFNEVGIAIDFIIEQYAFKVGEKYIVSAEKGDVVFDLGACWGDTALYFASKVGEKGKVYSFEFIPDNIKIFNINKGLNPGLADRIMLVPFPASNHSGDTIYFKDEGPGSKTALQSFDGHSGSTKTITIDDFAAKNEVSKVDFIKMDIEGAELSALEGAIETIKKYKPKLAIAIYHSMEDFVEIPKWILGLNLGYELFIGHYTIHKEETVCFAKLKS